MTAIAKMLCVCVSVWPAIAIGQCPTAADLDVGVRLSMDIPRISEVYRRLPNGHIESTRFGPNGETIMITNTAHPLSKVSGTASAPSLLAERTDELDRLDHAGTWRSRVDILVGEMLVPSGEVAVKYLGPSQVQIGACLYDTWRVSVTHITPGFSPYMTVNHYAPALGLIIAIQRLDQTGAEVSRADFNSIGIETE